MGMPVAKPGRGEQVRDFPGLLDTDEPPMGGGDEQTNLTSHRSGELVARPGYRAVVFED